MHVEDSILGPLEVAAASVSASTAGFSKSLKLMFVSWIVHIKNI